MDSFRRGNRKHNRGNRFRGKGNRGKFGKNYDKSFGGDHKDGGHYNRRRNDSYRNKKFGKGGGSGNGGDKNYRRNDNKHNNSTFINFNAEVLCENEIGVTEYISDHEGFSGIIKARYSDFHVNEIDNDGNIAKLTNLSVPKDPVKIIEEDDEDLLHRYCYEHLPIETWDRIHALVQKPGPSKETVDIDVTNKTKEERTKIHESVKLVFGSKIVGSTVVRDGIKYVSFMKYDKNAKIDRREQWPKERGGDYVYFLVYKEHNDTLEAAMRIAEALRIKPSMLSYAGTKDRRGITTQWFCVKRIDPAVLAEKCKKLNNIHIGNFCYKKTVLKLGHLKGNRFRIALRNITAPDESVTRAVEALRDNGFLNYYGLQRFGNSAEVPTYEIGKQLLKGNWKDAVNLILKPRKFETDRAVGRAKKIYRDTGDTKKALQAFGPNRDRTIEAKLLQGLQKHHENDLVNALEFVPRNMRLLYIHAYQSFIWNKILSRRIKEFGLKPIVGDLVLLDPEANNEFQTEVIIRGGEEEKSENDEKNEEKEVSESENKLISESEDGGVEKPEEKKQNSTRAEDRKDPKVNVKVLAEEDLSNYNIYDIVLPMPGFGVQYPNNIIREWYRELLEQDGLELEMTKIKVRTYCVSGTYRKCVERAENLTWKIIKYDDPLRPVIRSDYDELKKRPEAKSVDDGPYKALILDFCLPSASYATMALREILKTDTSSAAHAKLNDYHDQKKNKDKKKRKNSESSSNELEDGAKKSKTDESNTEKNETKEQKDSSNDVDKKPTDTDSSKMDESINKDTGDTKTDESSSDTKKKIDENNVTEKKEDTEENTANKRKSSSAGNDDATVDEKKIKTDN